MVSETLIIIVVVAAVAVFALLLVSYMFWSKSKRNAIPLPPVQPLAHDRERGLQALAAEKEREKSLYLQLVAPSWPDIKSAGSSESGSTANTYHPVPPGISPVKRYPHSVASSARSNLSSGIPHAPNSTVQIVLPAPLSLASNFAQDTSRYSVADEWASQAIYNDQPTRLRSSHSLSKSHTRSQSHFQTPPTSSPQTRSRTNSLSNLAPAYRAPPVHSKSYPPIVPSLPPPVPRIPSMYSEFRYAPRASDHSENPPRRSRSRGPSQSPDSQLPASENPPRRSRSRGPSRDVPSQSSNRIPEPPVPIIQAAPSARERSRSRGRSHNVPSQNLDWVSEALVMNNSRTRQSSLPQSRI